MIRAAVPDRWRMPALSLLARAEAHDGATLADMLQGCTVIELHDGAELVGAYAVELTHDGRELHVSAAGGEPASAPLVPFIFAHVEAIARQLGAERMSCSTSRPGLARRLVRLGGHVERVEGGAFHLTKQVH